MSGPRPTAALTVSVLGSVRHRAAARLPAWASGVFKCEYRCVRSAPARPGALLVLRVRGSGFRTEQVLFNSGVGGCLFLKRLSVTVGLILGVMCGTLPLTRTWRGSQGQRSSDTRTEAERLADPPAPLHPPRALSLSAGLEVGRSAPGA